MRGERPFWQKLDPSATDIRQIADPEIDALPKSARAVLADIWQERANSELKVAGCFCAVAGAVIEHGVHDEVLRLVTRATRDEVRHAEIAADMASRYADRDVIWPGPTPYPVPKFEPADPRLRATLLVLAMCCINETLACGILEGQSSIATSPLTKAALQSVLTDEIDHARAGWAHLASSHVTPEMKAEIGKNWLPRLLAARLSELFASEEPFPGEDQPAHGILVRADRKRIIGTGLVDVVLPGFERAGIDASRARAWTQETFGPWLS
ncbi:MAG TPA: ferritin-like domain-containing protein [Labilithrix sp.]